MKWKLEIICVVIATTKMKRAKLTVFSEGDYFILVNHSFAIEWKGTKKLKNSNSFHFLKPGAS